MQLNLKKKAYYFTPFDILRPRTNQISDVRFCEGLVQNGFEVTLIAPFVFRTDNLKKNSVLEYYGVKDKYKVIYLPTFFTADIDGYWRIALIAFLNSMLFFALRFLAFFQPKTKFYFFSRSPFLLLPILLLKRILFFPENVTLWLHEIKSNFLYKHIIANSDYLLATNSEILQDVKKQYSKYPEKTGLTLNPVSVSQVELHPTKEEAKKKIKAGELPLIVYTGKLFIGQLEVEYILQAAKLLPNYQFLLTGGKPHVIKHYEQFCKDAEIKNIRFTGYINDYRDLVYYQAAADALVSYYTTKEHDVRYNFPQKIIEYMLSGGPIVSPDYPATRDVLHESNCIFVEPSNPEKLAAGIKIAIESHESKNLVITAKKEAKNYTFKNQIAQSIIKDIT